MLMASIYHRIEAAKKTETTTQQGAETMNKGNEHKGTQELWVPGAALKNLPLPILDPFDPPPMLVKIPYKRCTFISRFEQNYLDRKARAAVAKYSTTEFNDSRRSSALPVQDDQAHTAEIDASFTRYQPTAVNVLEDNKPMRSSNINEIDMVIGTPATAAIELNDHNTSSKTSVQVDQQRAALTRIEPNQVSITRPLASKTSTSRNPFASNMRPRSALAKPAGSPPLTGPLGIMKFIRNFRLGKPPPPPLVTKHRAQALRKSVGFYESPKTGGPVTRTKRFAIGEPIDHPSPTTTYDETSIMSNQSTGTQLQYQSLMDAQLHTIPTSETGLSSSAPMGGEISVDSTQQEGSHAVNDNYDNSSKYQANLNAATSSSPSLRGTKIFSGSTNKQYDYANNIFAIDAANAANADAPDGAVANTNATSPNTTTTNTDDTNSNAVNTNTESNAQPQKSASEPGSSSSNLNKVVDGDLSARKTQEQDYDANDAGRGHVIPSIEDWVDNVVGSLPSRREKPKPVEKTRVFGIIKGSLPKTLSLEDIHKPFAHLNFGEADFAGVSPRRASKRLQAQEKRAAEEKAAREKKEAEERAQREKEDAELRAQFEREAEEQRQRLGVRRFTKDPIIQPLTAEWNTKVDAAMATSTDAHLPEGLVKSVIINTPLSRQDFGRVLPIKGTKDNPSGWLNDAIISAYLELITEMGNVRMGLPRKDDRLPKAFVYYHAFNPYLFKKLNGNGGYNGVRTWATKAGIGGKNLLKTEYVFIPVNQGGNHWTLATVSGKRRTIEYWDSFGGDASIPVACVKRWLKGELGSSYKEEEWTVKGEEGQEYDGRGKGPSQTNGYDCGVFAITTAKNITLNIDPMSVAQKDMQLQRRRIIAELLNKGFHGDFEPRFEYV